MTGTVVYVNDNPTGPETEVYHSHRAHATTLRRWSNQYVREMTIEDAQAEGLRPCKTCFPGESSTRCPACGYQGRGDDVLANGQRWCGNDNCTVVSYREGDA